MPRDYYTHYPRTILWLVRGGTLEIPDPGAPGGKRTLELESFYIGKFPITNEQIEAGLPGFVRSPFSPADGDPATGVSFDEALAFAAWYAAVSRKPMRLPTADEWEYACRAGSAGQLDPDTADASQWDADNSVGKMQALDEKRPNEFGLYGLAGGVWEWTSTRAGRDSGGDRRRLLMGGSVLTPRPEASCCARRIAEPDWSAADVGFRIARSFR